MGGKGRRPNSLKYDDKNMLGNIGSLFVKCMQQVTKGHLYHLLEVSDYYDVWVGRPVSFVKHLQRSPTGYLSPSEGSVNV